MLSKISRFLLIFLLIFSNNLYASDDVIDMSNSTSGQVDLASYIEFIRDGDFTISTSFSRSEGGLASLIYFSKKEDAARYLSFYLVNGKIGYELQPKGTRFEASNLGENFGDGNAHKLVVSLSLSRQQLIIQVDGSIIHARDITEEEKNYLSRELFSQMNYAALGTGMRNNQPSWSFSGGFSNNKMLDRALEADEFEILTDEAVFSVDGNQLPYTTNDAATINKIKSMNEYTITATFLGDANTGKVSVFKLAGDSKQFDLYINPSQNSVGLEINGNNMPLMENHLNASGVSSIKDSKIHTFTLKRYTDNERSRFKYYIDGKYINTYGNRDFNIDAVDNASNIQVAEIGFSNKLESVKVIDRALEDTEIQILHHTKDLDRVYQDLSAKYDGEYLFYSHLDGSNHYRIPSLLTTQRGTLLAATDKRYTSYFDAGNIDTIVRRKETGKANFDLPITILDLFTANNIGAFTIDPSMLQAPDGTIYMIVDMFPQSNGLFDDGHGPLVAGSGYREIDGQKYLRLFGDDGEYTVRENGIVYNGKSQKTEYRVITADNLTMPYSEFGSLYKNDEYKGNIFIYRGAKAGELHVMKTSYLWLLTSKDDGKTWSAPRDLNKMVKPEWSVFLGAGPGVGTVLENGYLLFPVYTTNAIGGLYSQSSHLIISRDNGETWELSQSPQVLYGNDPSFGNTSIQLTEAQAFQTNNGEVHMFMRSNAGRLNYAISKDFGFTWDRKGIYNAIVDVYCQMSSIHFNKNGHEYVMHVGPSISGRNQGKVTLGEVRVDEQGNSSITWIRSQLLNTGRFQYSSISQIDDNRFAVIFETDGWTTGGPQIDRVEFDFDYLFAGELAINDIQATDLSYKIKDGNLYLYLDTDFEAFAFANPKLTLNIDGESRHANYLDKLNNKLVFKIDGISNANSIELTAIDSSNGYIHSVNGGNLNLEANLTASLATSAITASVDQSLVNRLNELRAEANELILEEIEGNYSNSSVELLTEVKNEVRKGINDNLDLINLSAKVSDYLRMRRNLVNLDSYTPLASRYNQLDESIYTVDSFAAAKNIYTELTNNLQSYTDRQLFLNQIIALKYALDNLKINYQLSSTEELIELRDGDVRDLVFTLTPNVDNPIFTYHVADEQVASLNNLNQLQAIDAGKTSITIRETTTGASLTIPVHVYTKLVDENNHSIESTYGSNHELVVELKENKNEIKNRVIENTNNTFSLNNKDLVVYDISIFKVLDDDHKQKQEVSDSNLKISLAVDKVIAESNPKIIYIADDGLVEEKEILSIDEVNENTSTITFTTSHLSEYAVTFDVIDNSELNNAISKAEAKKEEENYENRFEVDSRNILDQKLADAKAALTLRNQEQVNQATEALNNAIDNLVPTNEEALNQAKIRLKQLIDQNQAIASAENFELDYTTDSIDSFKQKLSSANEVYNKVDASLEEVNQKVALIENLDNQLVLKAVDNSQLQALIERVETKQAEDNYYEVYTEESRNNLDTVLLAAKSKLDSTRQSEINQAIDNLTQAFDSLREITDESIDKTLLEAEIVKAEKIDAEGYTNESIANLQDKLNQAKQVLENTEASQEEVNTVTSELATAINSLTVDKNELVTAIEKAKAKKGLDKYNFAYSNESKNNLDLKLNQAMIVLNDEQANVQTVKTAVSELVEAIDNLDVNKKMLESIVNTYNKANQDAKYYISEDLTEFKLIADKAQELIAQDKPTYEQFIELFNNLLVYKQAHKPGLNKSVLTEAIKNLENLDTSNYDDSSKSRLQRILTEVKAIDLENLTLTDLKTAMDKIENFNPSFKEIKPQPAEEVKPTVINKTNDNKIPFINTDFNKVKSKTDKSIPNTGLGSMLPIYIGIASVAMITLIFLFVVKRRKNNK